MTRTTNIFGYNFICDASYEQLADELIGRVKRNETGITNFITPNAHGINMYIKHGYLNEFCRKSEYILPDGQPIVWLSRLTPSRISRRLTGSDFFPVMYKRLKDQGIKCLFVVSNEDIMQRFMAERTGDIYIIPPYFDMNEREKIASTAEEIFKEIVSHEIGYVFIGISEPKQGALAFEVTKRLNANGYERSCVFFFLGASFEFYFGLKKRAPALFQKIGMEWFYRLITEPGRMYKRYIFGNAVFLLRALKWFTTKKSSV
jgi:N-acetylglucosaminyldiphosphoundecaprenol N-acetyl-beta-D-mannosaminyltransferase